MKLAAILPEGTACLAEEPYPAPYEDFVVIKVHSARAPVQAKLHACSVDI